MPLNRRLILGGRASADAPLFNVPAMLAATDIDPLNAAGFRFARGSTAWNQNGVSFANNIARFGSTGLRIEGARTNYAFRSQQMEITYWVVVSLAWTADGGSLSPDGVTNSDRATDATGGSIQPSFRRTSFTSNPTGRYCASIMAKYIGRRWLQIKLTDTAAVEGNAWFDMQNGVVGTKTVENSGVTDIGSGFMRYHSVWTSPTGLLAGLRYQHRSADASEAAFSTAGETTDYINAQMEEASFPSTPIVTNTVNVTRQNETCIRVSRPFTRGTVLLVAQAPIGIGAGEEQILYQCDDNTTGNVIRLSRFDDLTTKLTVTCGGVTYTALGIGSWANDAIKKVGFSISNGRFQAYMNGGTVQQLTTAMAPSCSFERLGHGGTSALSANHWFGLVTKAQRVPVKWDAQLSAAVSAM